MQQVQGFTLTENMIVRFRVLDLKGYTSSYYMVIHNRFDGFTQLIDTKGQTILSFNDSDVFSIHYFRNNNFAKFFSETIENEDLETLWLCKDLMDKLEEKKDEVKKILDTLNNKHDSELSFWERELKTFESLDSYSKIVK
jgi:hypothetical protein